MIIRGTFKGETYSERQERLRIRKIAKQLQKHKETCLGNKKKRKKKK